MRTMFSRGALAGIALRSARLPAEDFKKLGHPWLYFTPNDLPKLRDLRRRGTHAKIYRNFTIRPNNPLIIKGHGFRNAGFTLNAGRTVILHGPTTISPTTGTFVIGQAITTGGGLTKTGAGTLELGGANTYSGSTLVNAGTLTVTGSIAGDVNVAAAGTLSGPGSIGGAITLNGTEAPGAGIGTLSSGPQTFSSNATFVVEIDDATGTAGVSPGWDNAAITGGLNITATPFNPVTIKLVSLNAGSPGNIANFSSGASYSWTIASTTEGITNFSANAFVVDSSSFSNSVGSFGTFRVVTKTTATISPWNISRTIPRSRINPTPERIILEQMPHSAFL